MIPTDDQLFAEGKKFAYQVFKKSNDDLENDRAESVSRHALNGAVRLFGYTMKVAEQEDYAPSIGAVLEEMRQSISKENASE